MRRVLPEGFDQLCCGQMLASKGMAEEAEGMSNTLEAALMKASENGSIPGDHGRQHLHRAHAEAPGRSPRRSTISTNSPSMRCCHGW